GTRTYANAGSLSAPKMHSQFRYNMTQRPRRTALKQPQMVKEVWKEWQGPSKEVHMVRSFSVRKLIKNKKPLKIKAIWLRQTSVCLVMGKASIYQWLTTTSLPCRQVRVLPGQNISNVISQLSTAATHDRSEGSFYDSWAER